MVDRLSYKKAGVDIDTADSAKKAMASSLETTDTRVLNRIGAFATLLDARFPDYEHPVLVIKTEEPGSKQKLAFQYNHVRSICFDLVNHLINDIIVMGAKPLSVQDIIICDHLDKDTVSRIVASIAEACREQDCVLTGGETSEQPGVITDGGYVLGASVIGVVEKSGIIDGLKIEDGDAVLAVASNGVHTNGYSLIRALIARRPDILDLSIGEDTFLETILRPHKCYYQAFRGLFDIPEVHGIAHITGGGIEGNLHRILPSGLTAVIDLSEIRILPIFKAIREAGNIDQADMMRTFNLGVGMIVVAAQEAVTKIQKHLSGRGCGCHPIGAIKKEDGTTIFHGRLNW
ncbi:MAG: phosphoribosylformylglycinamidine cyclo-ligase [Deltaproteobacteria bacterium]|nr:phosphoribosylformylglycinamidine cyclo-ligase [Deltaproteobacteria bacterium]